MRGHYRILLGMAAGVGKTYRMLEEGQQARKDGLEVVPRLRNPYGDLPLEEMDVDAVIRRSPGLALIDELAHTNAPGMRNEKRYEDIDEILDAGIDVISTVNVQ